MKTAGRKIVMASLVLGAAAAMGAVDRSGYSAASNAIALNHLSASQQTSEAGGFEAMFRTWAFSDGIGLETSVLNFGLLLLFR